MKILTIVGSILSARMLAGTVSGPDGRLSVAVETDADGVPRWQVSANGRAVTEKAPLGLLLNCGDFTKDLKIVDEKAGVFRDRYSLRTIKKSSVEVEMNTLTVAFAAPSGEKLGVKGVKVDFWGGDKQETFRLYEQVMSDADDHGLMTIFHGCTIPRGWERMYPNYVGSEAVLASENHHFSQYHCDRAALNATLHPFIRNALGCMEFGGTFLNKSLEKTNKGNRRRRTSDWAECATAVLFQNPIQNFALTPNNLTDAPADCIAFMKTVPTTWDETRFLAGCPGKYVVLARRHGTTWYVAGIANEDVTCAVDLAFAGGAKETIAIRRNDGFVRVMGRGE